MCALFGFSSYKNLVSHELRKKLTKFLAVAAEERGTDATGISYTYKGKVIVYKKPKAAHNMKFFIPSCAQVVQGHTRLTTKGDECYNYNNHPFIGKAGKKFALAHNGVLYNDDTLRRQYKLPDTKIETDSYVAVQLLEQQGELSFETLKFMAEKVKGMFTFSVLDEDNSIYIVKGDNPLTIYHLKELGLYVYASTRSILNNALLYAGMSREKYTEINPHDGDIVKIESNGTISYSEFTSDNYKVPTYDSWCHLYHFDSWLDGSTDENDDSVSQLLEICPSFGINPDDVITLIETGYYSVEEIEEMLNDKSLMSDALECCCMT